MKQSQQLGISVRTGSPVLSTLLVIGAITAGFYAIGVLFGWDQEA